MDILQKLSVLVSTVNSGELLIQTIDLEMVCMATEKNTSTGRGQSAEALQYARFKGTFTS